MARLRITHALCVALAIGASPAALAQQAIENKPQRPAHSDDSHADDAIVVRGHPPVDFGLLAATVSIEGDTLLAETRGQIGEILTDLPGVSATSFAPGASRPVLRGLGGDRVAVLLDGIGSVDASNVSVDHAVVFDPLTIDHIDVHHGPAVLLFGGNAIGGAVNALDRRIPRRVPDRIALTGTATYGTAADERAIGAALEAPLTPRLAVHLDANWRKSDDLRTGGFIHSAPLRSELASEAAELRAAGEPEEADEFAELAGLSGRIPNSAARSYTLGGGIAFLDPGGDIGISVQHFDTLYGVPLRPGAGHHHEENVGMDADAGDEHGESVRIDLRQTRFDLRGSLNFDGFFDSLQFRGAYGDYRHVELEGEETGTVFASEGLEFRADLIQSGQSGWRGRSGIQYFTRTMDVDGAEAFTPDYEVERIGFFTLQSLTISDRFKVEAAGRFEHSRVDAGSIGFARAFNLWSGGVGLSYEPVDGLTVGVNYLRGARAPSPEELLSDGLHVATQAYELGDTGFSVETSDSIEGYIRYSVPGVELSLTGYHIDFNNFVTALPTGNEIEDFPVFRYAQLPARFTGFEASASVTAATWAEGALTLDAAADYTRARLKGVGPVPRIPPLRLRGGAEVRQGDLRLRGEVEWNDRQDRVAAFAEPVPGFTIVNVSADWHPLGEDGPLTLILSGENLLDAVGRRAASFTRDFVPLPGRDIRLTARVAF